MRGEAFATPLEAVCELGVVTHATEDAIERALNDDAILNAIAARYCGESCDAVRAFVKSPLEADHQFSVEPSTTEDWPLPPPSTWDTVAPRLTPQERVELGSATQIIVIHAQEHVLRPSEKTGAPRHLAFRTCVTVAASLVDSLGGFVYDEVVRRIENARDFQTHVITSAPPAPAFRADHIVVQSYEEGGLPRMLTLGMARFGAPDVEARGFDPAAEDRMAMLINAVADKLARGETRSPISVSSADVTRVTGIAGQLISETPTQGEVRIVNATTHADGDPDNGPRVDRGRWEYDRCRRRV